jgi:hypothetical protein
VCLLRCHVLFLLLGSHESRKGNIGCNGTLGNFLKDVTGEMLCGDASPIINHTSF